VNFVELLALEPHGPDTFVGSGPLYPWGGLYGGQIVAQGLRAAALTVDPHFRAHSLHAYFIRRGDPSEPIRFEVDRLRQGRSFVTRAVVARQSTGAILNMSASFQVAEEAIEVSTDPMPAVSAPGHHDSGSWTALFSREFVRFPEHGRVGAWMRTTETLPDDPVIHACALAYISDDLATDAVRSLVVPPDRAVSEHDDWVGTSLDHAIWFHRPQRADGHCLHEYRSEGLINARGLAVGRVFTADGTHVASLAQEVLMRRARR
jgi:acyl-CoA thioesterase-2